MDLAYIITLQALQPPLSEEFPQVCPLLLNELFQLGGFQTAHQLIQLFPRLGARIRVPLTARSIQLAPEPTHLPDQIELDRF